MSENNLQDRFRVRIAELDMDIWHYNDYVKRQCRDYLSQDQSEPVLTVKADEKAIEKEWEDSGRLYSRGYCENICICRDIAGSLLRFQCFLLHAAVIDMDGCGYAFAAPSGTGKSTHIGLWKEVYGERIKIINGDKPIVKYKDGKFFAYGTPWCGKENLGINESTPLAGLCFLERAKENTIRRAEPGEAALRLLHQVLRPEEEGQMEKMLEILDLLLQAVPCYIMGCNMEKEAAVAAYETMGNTKEKL